MSTPARRAPSIGALLCTALSLSDATKIAHRRRLSVLPLFLRAGLHSRCAFASPFAGAAKQNFLSLTQLADGHCVQDNQGREAHCSFAQPPSQVFESPSLPFPPIPESQANQSWTRRPTFRANLYGRTAKCPINQIFEAVVRRSEAEGRRGSGNNPKIPRWPTPSRPVAMLSSSRPSSSFPSTRSSLTCSRLRLPRRQLVQRRQAAPRPCPWLRCQGGCCRPRRSGGPFCYDHQAGE